MASPHVTALVVAAVRGDTNTASLPWVLMAVVGVPHAATDVALPQLRGGTAVVRADREAALAAVPWAASPPLGDAIPRGTTTPRPTRVPPRVSPHGPLQTVGDDATKYA